jgi:hypothetical protein
MRFLLVKRLCLTDEFLLVNHIFEIKTRKEEPVVYYGMHANALVSTEPLPIIGCVIV